MAVAETEEKKVKTAESPGLREYQEMFEKGAILVQGLTYGAAVDPEPHGPSVPRTEPKKFVFPIEPQLPGKKTA